MKSISSQLLFCVLHANVFVVNGFVVPTSKLFTGNGGITNNHVYRMASPQNEQDEDEVVDLVPQPYFKELWEKLRPVTVQGGGALRTWSLPNDDCEFVEVLMKTDDRSLNTNIQVWQGPNNTPQTMKIYDSWGDKRPIRTIIPTPAKESHAIAIRNIGPLEYPVRACVEPDVDGSMGLADLVDFLWQDQKALKILQGGSTMLYPFDRSVSSVQILIKTDGRPCEARIELLQGPNEIKISVQYYAQDGFSRPCYLVFQTPGDGNVVRIVNTAPNTEFPFYAAVEPYRIGDDEYTLFEPF